MYNIRKRDGNLVPFESAKAENAIKKAFSSTGITVDDSVIKDIVSNIEIWDEIGVEDIQDQIEELLMDYDFPSVAKEYIIYREKHKDTQLIRDKINYIINYSKSTENAASNSNTDANANNSIKNVASIEPEVFKDKNRLIQRQLLKNKLNELYPEVAKQYEIDLNNHIIYCHDESSSPIPKAYCGAYTLYPLMNEGVGNIDNITPTPPNDIQSFSGQVTNLVFALSAQTKGAVALSDYLVTFNYYINQEYGEEWYTKYKVVISNEHCLNKVTIEKEIKKGMKQFIYGINQPQGNRGYQSPFTNCSIFDYYYFNSLFGDYYYPDGTKPKWEAVDILQRIFISLLRELRLLKPLTFPVTTFALLYDNNGYRDQNYANLCAEEWAKGSSHFLYQSSNADSLSSCCMSKDTKVLWKSSTSGVNCTTLEELHNLKWEPYKKNLKIFHNGSWVRGKSIKLPNRDMYKVTLWNNKEYLFTDNHIHVCLNGEKTTDNLTENDYLMFNTSVLNPILENDEHLTYEQGLLIGLFIGDGTFGNYVCLDDSVHNFMLSLNKEKWEKVKDSLSKLGEFKLGNIHNNVYPIHCNNKELTTFISKWTTNEPNNTYAYNKRLNLNCLLQSVEFRQGILDGWYITDGGNSNRCYTISEELVEAMEILCTSLGKQTVINVSDRTNEAVIIRGVEYNRNYPLYCLRWYEDGNHRVNKEANKTWIKKNNSIFFKIKSIKKVEYTEDVYCIECNNQDEPYFTLPSGLITHNCRVQNKLTDNYFSSTTGMVGVMTGSCNVITLNINRIVQDAVKLFEETLDTTPVREGFLPYLKNYLSDILERVYKYHIAYKTMLYELEEQGMITYSTANYLYMKKLYSTIGVIGYYEAAKFLNLEDNSEEYQDFMVFIMETINNLNAEHSIYDKKKPFIFNLEAIPGENLAVKFYNWDRNAGYKVPEDQNLYNCYFFNPWKEDNILNKIKAHGSRISKASSGGQGCHLNLQEHLSKEQYLKVMDFARTEGCNYFTFNIPMSECEECHHVVNAPITECPLCNSKNISYYTRIIGFLTKVNNWSNERQQEFTKRYFGKC